MSTVLAHLRCRLAGRCGEEGAAAVMLVFLAIVFLAGAALVVDGGYALGERRKAMNHAEQAARIGADALSEGRLRDGTVKVNASAGQAAAQGYLGRIGASGAARVSGDEVTVTVRDTYDTAMLGLIGIGSISIEATASSRSITEDTK